MKKLLGLLFTTPLAITACGSLPVEEQPPVVDSEDQVEIVDVANVVSVGQAYGTTSATALPTYHKLIGWPDDNDKTYYHRISKSGYALWDSSSTTSCILQDLQSNYHTLANAFFTEMSHPMTDNGYTYSMDSRTMRIWASNTAVCEVYDYRDIYIRPTNESVLNTEIATSTVVLDENLNVAAIAVDETDSHNNELWFETNYNTSNADLYAFDIVDQDDAKAALDNNRDKFTWKHSLSTEADWVATIDTVKAEFIGLDLAAANAKLTTLNAGWATSGTPGDANFENRIQYANIIVEAISNATAAANA